jgi:hypothetical protein
MEEYKPFLFSILPPTFFSINSRIALILGHFLWSEPKKAAILEGFNGANI